MFCDLIYNERAERFVLKGIKLHVLHRKKKKHQDNDASFLDVGKTIHTQGKDF